jgi:hypothetical protein
MDEQKLVSLVRIVNQTTGTFLRRS